MNRNRFFNAFIVLAAGFSLVTIANRLGMDGTSISMKQCGIVAVCILLTVVFTLIGGFLIENGNPAWRRVGYIIVLMVVGGLAVALIALADYMGLVNGLWAFLVFTIIAIQVRAAAVRGEPRP